MQKSSIKDSLARNGFVFTDLDSGARVTARSAAHGAGSRSGRVTNAGADPRLSGALSLSHSRQPEPMTDTARKDLDQINESLESLRETAKGISVDAGSASEEGQIGERAHVLSKALEGVRSDVQALRDRLEE